MFDTGKTTLRLFIKLSLSAPLSENIITINKYPLQTILDDTVSLPAVFKRRYDLLAVGNTHNIIK